MTAVRGWYSIASDNKQLSHAAEVATLHFPCTHPNQGAFTAHLARRISGGLPASARGVSPAEQAGGGGRRRQQPARRRGNDPLSGSPHPTSSVQNVTSVGVYSCTTVVGCLLQAALAHLERRATVRRSLRVLAAAPQHNCRDRPLAGCPPGRLHACMHTGAIALHAGSTGCPPRQQQRRLLSTGTVKGLIPRRIGTSHRTGVKYCIRTSAQVHATEILPSIYCVYVYCSVGPAGQRHARAAWPLEAGGGCTV
jgi:hypothetical protein